MKNRRVRRVKNRRVRRVKNIQMYINGVEAKTHLVSEITFGEDEFDTFVLSGFIHTFKLVTIHAKLLELVKKESFGLCQAFEIAMENSEKLFGMVDGGNLSLKIRLAFRNKVLSRQQLIARYPFNRDSFAYSVECEKFKLYQNANRLKAIDNFIEELEGLK